MSVEYAIIVKNKTRLESLNERFNTQSQAQFYIERQGGNFEDYEAEHEEFHYSLNSLQTQLSKTIKHKIVERVYVPSYIFSDKNLIVVIGQDGLVANTAKYSKGIPIVAVNPDINRYDGVLLPFNTSNFMEGVENVMANKYNSKNMRFAEAKLNDGQRLLAFNDLFVGASSHISARYKISFKNNIEEQSSSGLIISTLTGSTGWMSSVFNMAYGITNEFDNNPKPKLASKSKLSSFVKNSSGSILNGLPALREDELLFAVREPFKSIRTQTGISAGLIKNQQTLKIESLMPTSGVIFSDGIESDFLKFNSGSIVTIGIAKETAKIVTH